ncbi:MAG: hypothetical protein SGI74_04295, partial [Oligoflexia bacterium]|nr:hypothetical protein [Oligoflexia bacterium]
MKPFFVTQNRAKLLNHKFLSVEIGYIGGSFLESDSEGFELMLDHGSKDFSLHLGIVLFATR